MARVLVDNDVLIKLAHWGLLDHFAQAMGVTWADVSAPPSLLFRAQRADTKLFRDAAAARALAAHLATAQSLAPDPAVVEALQGLPGLDAGEVLLIADLAKSPDAVLVTGDKRALAALAASGLRWLHPQLSGRILCLEQVLALIAKTHGPDDVVAGIDRHRELDIAARCAIGSTRPLPVEQLLDALESYIEDVRRQCGALLAR